MRSAARGPDRAADHSRAQILTEIHQLYRQLRAFPTQERPDSGRRGSAAYTAIETQIRRLADRYSAIRDLDP